MALPGLIDTLLQTVTSLEVFSTIVFEAETKLLGTKIFPQRAIPELNSGVTFVVLFSQEKPLR